MEGLSKQGERLSAVMQGLKAQPETEPEGEGITAKQPFTETDMDTMVSRDISIRKSATLSHEPIQKSTSGQDLRAKSTSLPNYYSGAKSYEDLNDKGFFE